MDNEIAEIARENREAWAGREVIAIVKEADGYSVHHHTADSVAPSSSYPDKRLAAARVLQLLHVGPVAPQSHPETACIGTVSITPDQ